MKKDNRVFGTVELIFDLLYLCSALALGLYTFVGGITTPQKLAGIMGILLVVGDSFHLLPRIATILTGDKTKYRKALGIGKMITSLTMTIFYIILWTIGILLFSPPHGSILTGILYALAAVRLLLCLCPQNKWIDARPPVGWGIIRNIPFLLQGLMVVILFWIYRNARPELWAIWLAVLLSFLFYSPVVLWSHEHPKLGMLMFPKTLMYLWLLIICLRL